MTGTGWRDILFLCDRPAGRLSRRRLIKIQSKAFIDEGKSANVKKIGASAPVVPASATAAPVAQVAPVAPAASPVAPAAATAAPVVPASATVTPAVPVAATAAPVAPAASPVARAAAAASFVPAASPGAPASAAPAAPRPQLNYLFHCKFQFPALVWAALCLLLLLPVAALLPGCGTITGKQAAPEVEAAAVPVMIVEASRGDVEVNISFTGVLEPETVVNVVHKTGGKVAEVRVKDGDRVPAGELLIRLDAAEITAQVAQAEAACEMARIQHETAAKSLEDTRALYLEEIVSRQHFEQVETQHKIAGAQVAQAEAALLLARTYLDDTFITAPIGGTVSGVTLNPGELVAPGLPVATINQMDTMEVGVQLTEKDIGRIATGHKVGVLVSAVSPELLEGEVVKISPVADLRTKTYELKVALPNAEGRLKAGMTATIQATVEADKDTIIIPIEAVLTQQGQTVVYVVEEGVARRRPVTLGLENGATASVLTGVDPGEQVVVRGQHYLQEASQVTVVEGGGATP